MLLVRKTASLLLAAAVLASLVACSAPASDANSKAVAAGCTPVASGKASNAVTVSGKYGAKPTVKIKTPVSVTKTQRTVVTTGKGKVAKADTRVNVDFTLYNGTSGKELTTTGFDGQTVNFTMDVAKFLPGLVKTIKCSTVGSRVVGVIPPADAFGTTGSTDLGVGAKESIVFVADVVSLAPELLTKATGTKQAPVAGMPTVKLNAKGVPTVTIPDTKQPAGFKESVLIKGTGAKVGTNTNVVVNYQGIIWNSKKVFNDSWAGGQTATFNTGQVVAGFKKALEGQTIGSQVLVVIPPSLGYGKTGSSSAGIKGTDDLVFIIDILGLG